MRCNTIQDGYYLSTYLSICDYCYLHDVFIRHDQNMALWLKSGNDIKLIRLWELERYTGLKHQFKPFYNLEQTLDTINYLLAEFNLSISDLNGIWGTPQLEKFSRTKRFETLDKRFSYHSFAHLFSGLLMDTDVFKNETIVALAVDGSPDSAYDKGIFGQYLYVGAVSKNGKILGLFPISSPGLLWAYLRKIYNMEEGSLMALGSASTSRLLEVDTFDLEIFNYNDFLNAQKYFSHIIDMVDKLTEQDQGILFNGFDPDFSEQENKISMVVKVLNDFSYQLMCRNIDTIVKEYSLDSSQTYLSLTGGFSLNCPINTKLLKKFKKRLLSPPCVNDSGLSLGIGLYEFYKALGDFNFNLTSCYWGKECPDSQVEEIVLNSRFSSFIEGYTPFDSKQAVEDVISGPVVWFNGSAEIGPRALGNRSILADPRKEESKDTLNRIKQRQWWRPVAPVIMEEHIHEWFEDGYPSKYMLNAFYINEDKKALVPAICHLDNTARVQTLTEEDNPLLYKLISEFKRKTGIPMLCNTSLNDKGEPIINRIEEALHFALRKNIKIAYINGYRIKLAKHDQYKEDGFANREVDFNIHMCEKGEYKGIEEITGVCFDNDELEIYYKNRGIFNNYDIRKSKDAKKIKKMLTMFSKIKLEG